MNDKPRLQEMVSVGKVATIGIELAVFVTAGILIGKYFDARYKIEPWLTILGLIVGAAIGFYSLYKTIMNLDDKESPK